MNKQTSDKGSNRRRLRGFLVKPKEQLKYGTYFVLVSAIPVLLIAVPGYISLSGLLRTLAEVYRINPEASELIRKSMLSWLMMAIFNVIVMGFIAFNVGVVLTHRIFGAVVPLRRLIGQLKAGEYKRRVQLRAEDDLRELAADLNGLAEHLDEKYGSAT